MQILSHIMKELEKSNGLIERMSKKPLSDEEIYAIYRHSLDWRVLAREVERRHGIGD